MKPIFFEVLVAPNTFQAINLAHVARVGRDPMHDGSAYVHFVGGGAMRVLHAYGPLLSAINTKLAE